MTKKSHRNPAAPARAKSLTPRLLLAGIALVAIAVVALVWFALSPNRNSSGAAQLQVNTERLDFGKQTFESPVHASFDVRNTGSGTLTLSAPHYATLLEGCWPSVIIVGQTILGPGESTTVQTTFTMHEGMGGPHLFEIPLTTNDPAQPLKKLQIASDWQGR